MGEDIASASHLTHEKKCKVLSEKDPEGSNEKEMHCHQSPILGACRLCAEIAAI